MRPQKEPLGVAGAALSSARSGGCTDLDMGSSLNLWGPKRDPNLENYPYRGFNDSNRVSFPAYKRVLLRVFI